jgi:acyl-CoA dehydrogenase
MRRDLFTEDHEAFRELARTFVEKEVAPHYAEWEKGGRMPRDVFEQMGELGMLGMAIPEEYGGAGMPDYRYNVVMQEEAARGLVTLSTVRTQLEVILPYFLNYANAEQRARWFPGLAAGTLLTAVAMTEPGNGSDLAGMRTTAVRDEHEWVVNGAKTFITGGMQADLVIVVARTSTDAENRRKGLSLFVVEDGTAGFTRGRELEKMGCKVQDTAELSFVDVRVPAANLLGEEGEAFGYLGHNRPQERLTVAVGRWRRRGPRSWRRSTTRRTARRLARPLRRSRTPSSSSRRARPRWRPPKRCWTGRSPCTSTVSCRPPTRRG